MKKYCNRVPILIARSYKRLASYLNCTLCERTFLKKVMPLGEGDFCIEQESSSLSSIDI